MNDLGHALPVFGTLENWVNGKLIMETDIVVHCQADIPQLVCQEPHCRQPAAYVRPRKLSDIFRKNNRIFVAIFKVFFYWIVFPDFLFQ